MKRALVHGTPRRPEVSEVRRGHQARKPQNWGVINIQAGNSRGCFDQVHQPLDSEQFCSLYANVKQLREYPEQAFDVCWKVAGTAFETAIEPVCPEPKDKMDAPSKRQQRSLCGNMVRSCGSFSGLMSRAAGQRRARVLRSKVLDSTHQHRITLGNGIA